MKFKMVKPNGQEKVVRVEMTDLLKYMPDTYGKGRSLPLGWDNVPYDTLVEIICKKYNMNNIKVERR